MRIKIGVGPSTIAHTATRHPGNAWQLCARVVGVWTGLDAEMSRSGHVLRTGMIAASMLHATVLMEWQAAHRRQQPMLPGVPTPRTLR